MLAKRRREPCLEISVLRKSYQARGVLEGIDFVVYPGEIFGLLGPNGAGKSTAFKIAMGLVIPDAGTVIFCGTDVTDLPTYQRARMGMGYLAQEPSVFRDLTVLENLQCILELQGQRFDETVERELRGLLKELHLDHLTDQRAGNLSGGERRRLEITRVMMAKPRLLLLDEPFANVDPITLQDLKKWLKYFSERNVAILITDHNAMELLSFAHRNCVIGGGQVLAQGDRATLLASPIVRERYLGADFEL